MFNLFDFSKQNESPTSGVSDVVTNINKPTNTSSETSIDKEKAKRFIEHGIKLGKSKEEIRMAYDKAKSSGVFGQVKKSFGENVAGGFLKNIPSDVTSTVTGLTPIIRESPVVKPFEQATTTVGNLIGMLPGEQAQKAKKYIKDLNLGTLSDVLDKKASEFGSQLSQKMVGSVDEETAGYKTGRAASFLTSLLTPGGIAEKETQIPSTLYKGAKEMLPSVGKIIKPSTIEMPKDLSKKAKTAAEILHPKQFSEADLARGKELGNIKTVKGLNKDWASYIPNKLDKEVYETAGEYVKKGVSSTDNIALVQKGIEDESIALRTALKNSDIIVPKKEVTAGLNKAISELVDSPQMNSESMVQVNKLVNKFKAFLSEEAGTPEGILNARQKFDQYVNKYKPSAFDPKGSIYNDAVLAIRTGANDILANKVKDIAVKASLKKQSNLYRARKMLSTQTDQSKFGKILQPISTPAVAGLAGVGGIALGRELFKQ